jgi:hypothetical protein
MKLRQPTLPEEIRVVVGCSLFGRGGTYAP